jgi:minimal PKS acyl carrier protein
VKRVIAVKMLTIDDLMLIMRECAGEDESASGGQVADVEFSELGYDSLALLETASRVAREYAVEIPEEDLAAVRTPAEFVTAVNGLMVASASN